jgi:7-cyano-7-deazaguanine synthase
VKNLRHQRAVVLLSGGIDSSTTLAIAQSEGYECHALSFDYAQRHDIELISAKRVADTLGVKKHLIIRFDLQEIGVSALTDDIPVPKGQKDDFLERRGSTSSSIPITYVPARNTIFLSFALGWAEVLEASELFIGANAIDYSGYPDCRPGYLKAFEEMANLATRASAEGELRFHIRAPLLHLTKGEIIKSGIELGLDYGLTWSCYDPEPEGLPCFKCDSCRYRERGFQEAGCVDPLRKMRT